ncbi:unnamed protein product [Caenorhabditis bovis]|uniref:Phosphatidylinositol 4-kinase beta n=1 Tax=Caenorhabditis bovis TaxID=2654633 RepID=A0A8S1F8J1_9PELO|nr:unnamed protein product [Caenorhabditis bovis]
MSAEIKIENGDSDGDNVQFTKPLVEPLSWTMRLIASDSFNAPMAIEYLHILHDKASLSKLGKRLFYLPANEVDFFLPQLMYMYVNKIDAASVSHAYIESRNQDNPQFSILCSWLLDCYIPAVLPGKLPNHAMMLRGMMRNDSALYEIKPLEASENINECGVQPLSEVPTTSELINFEHRFVERLTTIGRKLAIAHLADSKHKKMSALKLELQLLNNMLPAPVWIPFAEDHYILQICYEESSVLNSKDKVPYIMFAEVLRSSERSKIKIPHKKSTEMEKNNAGTPTKVKFYHDTSDPSAAVFAESWHDKRERIRACSNYGGYDEWDLIPVIVKYGDDLTQESFAQQLLQTFKDLWREEGVPLYVRPYKIVCVGPEAGLIEPVLDTLSLHQIKRHLTNVFRQKGIPLTPTLRNHFEDMFGPPGSERYVNAQKNFIQSTAAYSLISYFLQLKDRHNGNILLDLEGHLIHIDYGFLLSSSPRNLGFETAPFKLTTELIDVMGGYDSDMFLYYKSLLLRGLMAARKHHRRIVSLAEIMSNGSKMQCFRAGPETVRSLEARFHVSSTDEQLQQLVDALVDGSRDSYTTRFYDSFQYYTNGIH